MALPDEFKLKAASSRSSGFSTTTIANAAAQDGSAIDNAANLDLFLTAEFVWSYGTNPTANRTVEMYLLYSVDGTNYEEESPAALIGSFSPPADTGTHRRVLIRAWPLRPFAFKLRLKNVDTGQTITVTVNAFTHNEQVVD